MSVITLIIILCFLAFLAWFVNTKLPGSPTIKGIINVVLIIIAIVLVLVALGVWDQIKGVQVPKL